MNSPVALTFPFVKIILVNKTKIYADNVKADFTGEEKTLKKAIAKGNVIIENNTEGRKSKANLGIYNSTNETVELKGNVVIINQGSTMIGSQGITNIKTGISKLTSNPDKKERVRGVFSPIKKSKKGDKSE